MSREQKGKKGGQTTAINQANYAGYIKELKKDGKKLPGHEDGTINLAEMCRQVGCTEKVFREGSLKDPLARDIKAIGTAPMKRANAESGRDKDKDKSKELSSLKKQLNDERKAVEGLQDQVQRLKKEIRQFHLGKQEADLTLQELMKSGRKFTL